MDIKKVCDVLKTIATHAMDARDGILHVSIQPVSMETKCPVPYISGDLACIEFRPFGHLNGAGMGKVVINAPPWEVRWEDISSFDVISATSHGTLVEEREDIHVSPTPSP